MDEESPVLVVGGSLVGLTASVLLARHGIRHILVERHRGTAIHPRAAAFHQRTLEIFRSAGLQEAVEQAAEREFVQNGGIMAVDTLGGRELAWFYHSVNDGVEDLSPTRRLFITQIGLEPVLRGAAEAAGADHRYGTDLIHFDQNDSGVTATLLSRDSGAEHRVRARYLIAADGAHSPVRAALGISMLGRGDFARCATIYFRADVRPLLRDRNLSVVYVNQPGLLGFFRFSIAGDAGFLAVFATFDGDGQRDRRLDQPLSEAASATLVRAALGVDADFPLTIENIQSWTATAATAERFRHGNIFLAGDAAHLMPPTGGFGGNTGVADVHNLVWKLAMVLNGRAATALLDSYEQERRPITQVTVEQAYRRYVERVDPSLPADNLAPNLSDTAIELGSVYRSDASLGFAPDRDQTEPPEHPSGRPGTRLAHSWIEHDRSTLDLVGSGMTLLFGPDGLRWNEADNVDGRVQRHQLTDRAIADRLGLRGNAALLLRPDGVIAWRSNDDEAQPRATLSAALDTLLGHGKS